MCVFVFLQVTCFNGRIVVFITRDCLLSGMRLYVSLEVTCSCEREGALRTHLKHPKLVCMCLLRALIVVHEWLLCVQMKGPFPACFLREKRLGRKKLHVREERHRLNMPRKQEWGQEGAFV